MQNYIIDLTSAFVILYIIGTSIKKILFGYITGLNSVKLDVEDRIEKVKNTHPLIEKEFDGEKVKKMVSYTNANSIFGLVSQKIGQGYTIPLVLLGIAPFLFHKLVVGFPSLGVCGAICLFSIIQMVYSSITELPSDIFDTFRIEKYFGFSTMTKGLYVKDTVKSFAVGLVITVISVVVSYFALDYALSLPNMVINGGSIIPYFSGKKIINPVIIFGLFAVGIITSVIMSTVWMYWISPLFNKFKPLEDGELKDKIGNLVKGCGRKLSGIYIMDESKRSTKGNAYCASIPLLGITKIVIYDNLLKTLTTDEIVAIFAHEMAHMKHRDGLKNLVYSLFGILVTAFGITFFSLDTDLYHAFGFRWVNDANVTSYAIVGITLVSRVIGAVSWILTPLVSILERKMEYAADRGAVELTGDAESMKTSLIKLYSKDLGDVLTHPAYEFCFYSHPSLVNRVTALGKKKAGKSS